jgi:hypothetical protein
MRSAETSGVEAKGFGMPDHRPGSRSRGLRPRGRTGSLPQRQRKPGHPRDRDRRPSRGRPVAVAATPCAHNSRTTQAPQLMHVAAEPAAVMLRRPALTTLAGPAEGDAASPASFTAAPGQSPSALSVAAFAWRRRKPATVPARTRSTTADLRRSPSASPAGMPRGTARGLQCAVPSVCGIDGPRARPGRPTSASVRRLGRAATCSSSRRMTTAACWSCTARTARAC